MMATLETKVILFDDSCPMCRLYTYGFVAAGILRKENRLGFSEADPNLLETLDLQRARHEIPLCDRVTGESIYGIKALTFVLSSRLPFMRPILTSPILEGMMWPVYRWITFNRRIMAGSSSRPGFDCAPDLHRGWRIFHILSAALISGLGIWVLAGRGVVGQSAIFLWTMWTIASLLLGILWLRKDSKWDYFGNVATLSAVFVFGMQSIVFVPQASSLVVLTLGAILLGWESHRRLAALPKT